MEFDISKHGDILEREYSDFIRKYVENYEEIWKRYIGNDGRNNMIIINTLNADEQKDREFFSQYHYTILESLACLDLIKTKLKDFQVDINDKVKSLLEFNNMLISFWGNIGRVRDNIKKIQNKLNIHNLILDIKNFYQTRNQILHDRKIPYGIIDGDILIPPIESGNGNNETWNKSKRWIEMDPNNFIELGI